MNPGVLKYRNAKVPRQKGEFARIRVLQGPDQGTVFVVCQAEAVIGRGREAQIRLSDAQASRSHCRLHFTAAGWKMDDLGSASGIFHDGEFLRTVLLRSGDHFTLGESVCEFFTNREDTHLLTAPISDDPDREVRDVALAQQKLRVRGMAEKVRIVARKGTEKKTNLLLILGVIGCAAYLYPDEARPLLVEMGLEIVADLLPPSTQPPKKPEGEKKPAPDRALSSYAPNEVAPEAVKTSEQYFKQGFRELNAGNHLRARALLELALQVNPAHDRARFYLASANRENDAEIRRLINLGKQSINIGRTREGRAYLQAALRRTGGDENDPIYTECIEALKVIESGGKI